jgi:hypothetical protein
LNTCCGEVIKISSSSSYQLSLFSSKGGPIHHAGEGAALGEPSSSSIGDLWPEINSSEGGLVVATHSSLRASSSRHLPGKEAKNGTLILSVFSAPANHRMVKIVHSKF